MIDRAFFFKYLFLYVAQLQCRLRERHLQIWNVRTGFLSRVWLHHQVLLQRILTPKWWEMIFIERVLLFLYFGSWLLFRLCFVLDKEAYKFWYPFFFSLTRSWEMTSKSANWGLFTFLLLDHPRQYRRNLKKVLHQGLLNLRMEIQILVNLLMWDLAILSVIQI